MAGQLRGNSEIEGMLGDLMGSMKPQFPTGMQGAQAGVGQTSQFAPTTGFNKVQQFGLLSITKKNFLKKYNGGLSRPALNPVIKPKDLLQF